MRVIAIDPGVSGALAVVNSKNGRLAIEALYDLPTYTEHTATGKARRYVDPVALAALMVDVGKADRVICERMVAPPGVASNTAFSMGATMATIRAVLRMSEMPYKLVSPAVWKRAIDVPADKEQARQHATRLFKTDEHWQRKTQHNRAEAALIGAYGAAN